MVSGKKDESQIDGGRADLHQDGIREIADGRFRIGFSRECSRELERGWSGHTYGMSCHGVNVSPAGRRFVSGMLKKAVQQGRSE